MKEYYKILCVDDEERFVKLVKLLLNEKLFEIDDAYDGGGAVTKAFRNTYDLILMDIRMPNMDGVTAAHTIKKMSPKVPIVAVSAFDVAHIEDMEIFDAIIRKPVDKDELRGTILKVLIHEE